MQTSRQTERERDGTMSKMGTRVKRSPLESYLWPMKSTANISKLWKLAMAFAITKNLHHPINQVKGQFCHFKCTHKTVTINVKGNNN